MMLSSILNNTEMLSLQYNTLSVFFLKGCLNSLIIEHKEPLTPLHPLFYTADSKLSPEVKKPSELFKTTVS